jgi:fused signal recognition particle receptor
VLKWFNKVSQVLKRRPKIDAELWDELEEALIGGDVSANVTIRLLDELEARSKRERWSDAELLEQAIREEVAKLLSDENPGLAVPPQKPAVYLLVGVNGTGKTTSAAKLAWDLKQQGKRVILAAADTFRAAAIDQLEVWAARAGVDIVKHQPDSDPSAVVFDAIDAARARGADVVIADTAGRLHNKAHLMQELGKIGRVTEKALGRAPDETLLVLDATTGQNAISQAKEFAAATPLTGVILTKMDGTAKGGVVLTLAEEMHIPVKFIGMGEKISDLMPFEPLDFADALFRSDEEIEEAQREAEADVTVEAAIAAADTWIAEPKPAPAPVPEPEPDVMRSWPGPSRPEERIPMPESLPENVPTAPSWVPGASESTAERPEAPVAQTEPAEEVPREEAPREEAPREEAPREEARGWRRFFRRG